jgi:PAS domain S-box-containing protein
MESPFEASTRMEASLPGDAEAFRLFVEAVRDYAIFMLDPQGFVITWNRGAERIKGYAAAEILGRHFSVFYRPQEAASGRPAEELRIARECGRYEERGWRVRKDGSEFFAHVILIAVTDASGRLIGFGKVTRDITEGQSRVQNLALLAAVFDDNPDAILVVDAAGRIARANPRTLAMFGYSPDALFGQPIEILLPERFRGTHQRHRAGFFAAPQPRMMGKGLALFGRRADGTEFPVDVMLSPMRWEGQNLVIAIVRDITENKAAEAALLRLNESLEEHGRELARARDALKAVNESLEETVATRTADLREANAEIQRFTYIVSHDLRAPLVNIMGFTSELEVVRSSIAARLAELPVLGEEGAAIEAIDRDFAEALDFIKASTAKMDRLIGAMLKMSREGRRVFVMEHIAMNALLSTIAVSLQHQCAERKAVIEIGKLPDILSDRLALEQIFTNLLDNAVKYLSADRAGRIDVSGTESSGVVSYEVRDNGRGIEARDRERIFELFRRAGAQDQPGEGIGLAHVRTLVRRLGGSISCDSEKGTGSVFRVVLPKTLPPEAKEPNHDR